MSPPRRTFGATWWGKAWIEALEGRARLDPNRLPRGRTYARQDRAGPLTVTDGKVAAKVSGSRRTPYSVEVRVRTFTDDEADRVVDAIAAKAAHAAALLDGELEPGVLDDVAAAGVDLLPGPGDLGPRCSCPDWADPCKHAAAVCYLVADRVDADPFVLFHLRGLPRARLLAAVRERRRAGSVADGDGGSGGSVGAGDGGAERVPVVAARDAFAAPQPDAAALWALPLPAAPARPGHPPPAAVDPPRSSTLVAGDLHDLAVDAAQRAWALVRGDAGSGLELPVEHDLARRAAPLLGTSAFGDLAARSGLRSPVLVTLALAWRLGGADAVTVTTESWTPPPGALDEGRAAVTAALAAAPALAHDGRVGLDTTVDADDEDFDEWDDDDDEDDEWDEWDDDEWDDDDEDGPRLRRDPPRWVIESRRDARSAAEQVAPRRRRGAAAPPDPPPVRAWANRLSAGATQVRLSRSGSWYRFAEVADGWELAAGPAPDPADLFVRR